MDVRLVRMLVTVKNPQGELVGQLGRDDFVVYDSGVAQELAFFERYTAQPLSVALLVDTSGSTARELKYEIESVARFLEALTREGNPNDALTLYSFNHDVTRQTGFIRKPERARQVLKTLKAEAGTSLYDALCFAADSLAGREGRRVVVAVTDGGDTTSAKTYQEALRALHDTDAVMYSVLVVPVTSDAGRNIGGENALTTLAASTGGRVFAPSVGAQLDEAFAEILRDLRTQYLLGYYPRGLPPPQSGFRRVRVEAKGPGLQVLSRSGYYEK